MITLASWSALLNTTLSFRRAQPATLDVLSCVVADCESLAPRNGALVGFGVKRHARATREGARPSGAFVIINGIGIRLAQVTVKHARQPMLREISVRADPIPAPKAVVVVLAHADEKGGNLVHVATTVTLINQPAALFLRTNAKCKPIVYRSVEWDYGGEKCRE